MYCKYCGAKIDDDCVICVKCGKQVAELKYEKPNIVINNVNNNNNNNANYNGGYYGLYRSKWVALFLCLFLGYLGAHKFYEGKNGMGILYLFTGGLFGVGWLIDTVSLLFKPNPYLARRY